MNSDQIQLSVGNMAEYVRGRQVELPGDNLLVMWLLFKFSSKHEKNLKKNAAVVDNEWNPGRRGGQGRGGEVFVGAVKNSGRPCRGLAGGEVDDVVDHVGDVVGHDIDYVDDVVDDVVDHVDDIVDHVGDVVDYVDDVVGLVVDCVVDCADHAVDHVEDLQEVSLLAVLLCRF